MYCIAGNLEADLIDFGDFDQLTKIKHTVFIHYPHAETLPPICQIKFPNHKN